MERSNQEALDQHRLTVGERYRTEFVAELTAVQQQVEMLRRAHADNKLSTMWSTPCTMSCAVSSNGDLWIIAEWRN
eukprot:2061748-Amphidinium_carterae.1